MNDYVRSILNTKFNFGKFKGKTIQEVLEIQPSYVNWCILNIDFFYITTDDLNELNKAGVDLHLSKQAYKKNKEKEDVVLEKMNEDLEFEAQCEKDKEDNAHDQEINDQQKPGYWDRNESFYWTINSEENL